MVSTLLDGYVSLIKSLLTGVQEQNHPTVLQMFDKQLQKGAGNLWSLSLLRLILVDSSTLDTNYSDDLIPSGPRSWKHIRS